MARPTIMKICLVIALTIAAGEAYAVGTVISSPTAVGAASFTPSNNVQIGAASAATQAQMYSANAKHNNGDRVIAFVSTDSRMYYSSGAPIGTSVATPTSSDQYSTCSAGTPWNSL